MFFTIWGNPSEVLYHHVSQKNKKSLSTIRDKTSINTHQILNAQSAEVIRNNGIAIDRRKAVWDKAKSHYISGMIFYLDGMAFGLLENYLRVHKGGITLDVKQIFERGDWKSLSIYYQIPTKEDIPIKKASSAYSRLSNDEIDNLFW